MNTVKFADLIKNSGGIDAKLFVCFSYAKHLTFKIQGSGLLVWVTGDDDNKQLILDINDLVPQRDHKVRKNFKAFKASVIATLEQKGLTNSEAKPVGEFEVPNIMSVIQ